MKYTKLYYIYIITLLVFSCSNTTTNTFSKELVIPPLLDYSLKDGVKTFSLSAQEQTHYFSEDKKINTLSYGNMRYLGPTIRVHNKDKIAIQITNNLNADTTLHQHGIHLPAPEDGNVFQVIKPNTTWTSSYTVSQVAGTFWYHPHKNKTTGYQVSQGLSGMLIIDDKVSDDLPIPKDYGIDDIPLIIQDKTFNDERITYRENNMHVQMMGNIGKVVVTNGKIDPVFTATRSLLRFRILNASTFAVHKYYLKDERIFYLIANDAGLLESPIAVSSILLAPSERREILVDISDLSTDEVLPLLINIHGNNIHTALNIKGGNFKKVDNIIPDYIVKVESLTLDQVNKKRTFNLQSRSETGTILTINNKSFDASRIDEYIPINTTELWTIHNPAQSNMMMGQLIHTFHPHHGSFQVVSYNGKTVEYPDLQGWKDTVLLFPGDTVQIIMQFNNYSGKYMYHCHQLEHEDVGMMGVFEIVDTKRL